MVEEVFHIRLKPPGQPSACMPCIIQGSVLEGEGAKDAGAAYVLWLSIVDALLLVPKSKLAQNQSWQIWLVSHVPRNFSARAAFHQLHEPSMKLADQPEMMESRLVHQPPLHRLWSKLIKLCIFGPSPV